MDTCFSSSKNRNAFLVVSAFVGFSLKSCALKLSEFKINLGAILPLKGSLQIYTLAFFVINLLHLINKHKNFLVLVLTKLAMTI